MRIHTKAIFNIETLIKVSDEFFEYDGPVDLCKNSELKAANAADAQAQQQQAAVAQQQLAQQQAQLQKYNDYVDTLIKGGGYTPGVREALTSQAINEVPSQFAQSASNMKTALLRQGAAGGGNLPAGGESLRGLGSLEAAQNQLRAQLLQNVTIGGQNNMNQAAQGYLQSGAQYGNSAGTFLGGSNQALGLQGQSANDLSQAQLGLTGALIGAGTGILTGGAGGSGGLLSSLLPKKNK